MKKRNYSTGRTKKLEDGAQSHGDLEAAGLETHGGTLAVVWPAGCQACSGPVTPSISLLFELECL